MLEGGNYLLVPMVFFFNAGIFFNKKLFAIFKIFYKKPIIMLKILLSLNKY
jgi:hypothetical protein